MALVSGTGRTLPAFAKLHELPDLICPCISATLSAFRQTTHSPAVKSRMKVFGREFSAGALDYFKRGLLKALPLKNPSRRFARFDFRWQWKSKRFFQQAGHLTNAWGVGYGGHMAD